VGLTRNEEAIEGSYSKGKNRSRKSGEKSENASSEIYEVTGRKRVGKIRNRGREKPPHH